MGGPQLQMIQEPVCDKAANMSCASRTGKCRSKDRQECKQHEMQRRRGIGPQHGFNPAYQGASVFVHGVVSPGGGLGPQLNCDLVVQLKMRKRWKWRR